MQRPYARSHFAGGCKMGTGQQYTTELRVSNGKIWRLRFEPDARRDDDGVVDALRRGGALAAADQR